MRGGSDKRPLTLSNCYLTNHFFIRESMVKIFASVSVYAV